jgi:hypothetical protein
MIRFVFRFVGLLLLAVGFVAIIRDGTKTIGGKEVWVTKLADDWYNIHQSSREALQPVIEQRLGHWAWDPVVTTILNQPTWVVFGVVAIVFILLGRKKKRLIGYARD